MTGETSPWEPFRIKSVAHVPRPLRKLLVLLLICIQFIFCWMAKDRSIRGDVDLRAFYAAGMMTRQGGAAHLYDAAAVTKIQQSLFGTKGRTLPFLYPAFAALPFVPLSFLPYSIAFWLVLLANLALLYASACLLSTAVRLSHWWLFGCFLCFFPVAITLMQGQISCTLLLLMVLSHTMTARGRMFAAGICLAFALIKFQFALPIVLLHIFWRRWRFLSGFLLGSVALLSVSLLLTGVHGAKAYAACMVGLSSTMLRHPALAQSSFGMQTAAEPNLHGLVTTLMGTGAASTLLLLGSSIAALVWAARRCRTVATALPAAMLVSYHMQPYDLLLLLLPLTLLWASSMQSELLQPRVIRALSMISVLLLITPVAPYLLATAKTTWFVLAVLGVLLASGRCSLQGNCFGSTHLSQIWRSARSATPTRLVTDNLLA